MLVFGGMDPLLFLCDKVKLSKLPPCDMQFKSFIQSDSVNNNVCYYLFPTCPRVPLIISFLRIQNVYNCLSRVPFCLLENIRETKGSHASMLLFFFSNPYTG